MGGRRSNCNRSGGYGLLALSIIVISILAGSIAFAQDFTATTLANYGDVTVMEVEGNYDADIDDSYIARQEIAKEFYKTHSDNYDFLVIFTNFDFEMPYEDTIAFYSGVRNDVHGIGRDIFDRSSFYGSDEKLQGTIDVGNLANLVSDTLNPKFSFTMGTLSHELLHRWASYIKFEKPDGSISADLLGKYDFHWSFLLDTRGSLHYGNRWQDNGDGTFTSLEGRKYYSPLDLYLMGLIDKSDVPPMLLIENTAIDKRRISEPGVTIEGNPSYVSIDDIIAAEGERVPGPEQSQKRFKIGSIFISRPGTFTGDELFAIRTIMTNWVMWFSSLTDGKASVLVDTMPLEVITTNPGIEPPTYDPRSAPPELDDGITWLMASQENDGSWRDTDQTVERDTAVAVLALSNFPDAEQNASTGSQWLRNISSDNLDYLARKIEAFRRTGDEITELLEELLTRQNPDGGWGNNRFYMSNSVDTSLALKALAIADYTDETVIEPAVEYLQAGQNPDGGWGYNDQGSSILPTANVVSAFIQYREIYSLDDQIQSASVWLLGKQNPDGGFGNSPSTVYDTATVVIALARLNSAPEILDSAIDYVLQLQSEDGSWYGSRYQTALAVHAIFEGTVTPDLDINTGDITFSPSSVTNLPQDVTIDAVIRNQGLTDIPEARVVLYDGAVSEETKIDEQILSFPGNASATATFSVTITDGETHLYYISVDPDNLVAESSETNNTALKALYPKIK